MHILIKTQSDIACEVTYYSGQRVGNGSRNKHVFRSVFTHQCGRVTPDVLDLINGSVPFFCNNPKGRVMRVLPVGEWELGVGRQVKVVF